LLSLREALLRNGDKPMSKQDPLVWPQRAPLCHEIALPRLVGARNDRENHCATARTARVPPSYLKRIRPAELTATWGVAKIEFGDIAQLGEHCVRIAGVGGSNPPISTIEFWRGDWNALRQGEVPKGLEVNAVKAFG
jgi:hypothetical protein